MNEGLWFIVSFYGGPEVWQDLDYWNCVDFNHPEMDIYVDYEYQTVWFKVTP